MITTNHPSLHLTLLAVVLGLLAVLPGQAQAQTNNAYDEAVDQAVVEYNAGNYEEAHALFRHAHSLSPSARTWRSLGVCAFELRLYVEAKADLEAALADPRKPLTPAQRTETANLLEKTRKFVSSYRVTLEPDDARVEVDGKPVKLVNETMMLDPGSHVVVVSAPEYIQERRELRTGAGIQENLRFELAKATSQSEPLNATQGSAPSDSERPKRRRRVWTWTLASTAVAASAVAVGLRLRVNGLHDEFLVCNAQGGLCDAVAQTGNNVQLGARLSGALAGGLAIGAVIAFFTEGAQRSSATTLLIGPRALAIRGTF